MTELSPAPAQAVWRHPEFRRGAQEMVATAMGIAAWGLVTGVAMTKSGLGVPLAVAMSLLVFAGSSQLASLPLIASGAPIWVVWATAFCVNLRFIIFSAQWRPYFGHFPRAKRVALSYFTADLNYVIFMRRFPRPQPSPEQVPYFLGGVAVNWLAWQVPSMIGIFAADSIPTEWGIGFAGTVALLGLIYSMLSDKATWISAAVAGCAAVAAYGLPLKLNILVAVAASVAIGLVLDHSARTPRPVEDRT
ncbi:AzlC family ABC transporter permease [Ideonella sp. BN130291]|uniref:AzlC family ABC transporter permease n=1 Tax=Ideonella sp. BN130291 TaxID=3112940 RepID=UPI002E26ED4B|nr:AzlC family ABC transporter permease [Ideonella sp. BN130291]